MDFVHLRTKSQYSLLNSVASIDDIADASKEHKLYAAGIADEMSLSGSLEFSSKMIKQGTKPLIGISVCVADDVNAAMQSGKRMPSIVLFAMNDIGYKNLIKILYKAQFSYEQTSMSQNFVCLADLQPLANDIICLSGGYNGILAQDFLSGDIHRAEKTFHTLKEYFGDRFYIELTRHGRHKEKEVEDFLVNLALTHNVPLVATNDVHFLRQNQFKAYDAACCIRDGNYMVESNRFRLNSEYYFKSPTEMIELFSDIPEALQNAVIIAKRCSYGVQEQKPMLPKFTTDGETEDAMLLRMANDGLLHRMKDEVPINYKERLDFELNIITNIGFAGYFLIVSDFVKWAKNNGVPVGPGRGSGAGSIVAWCLDITNVDPIKYGLLFERFLNPERVSMPDFDIDFCQTNREKAIDYVRNKYGNDKVASIMTFGKLQARAVLKDVGRVLQLPYNQVDSICKIIPFSPLEPITLAKAIEMDTNFRMQIQDDDDVKELVDISLELEGMNRHTSTHAAGIVIGNQPLTEIVPINKDHNSELPVVAFNMKDVEKIGLVKFDFLGLKTLSVIADACALIKKHRNVNINIDELEFNDDKTFELLRSTKLKGIFQLEAAIARETLHQIKVDKIEEIVAVTSLNRPGPMDNIPTYIKRKNGQEPISYPHPILEGILRETYGVIIYQEQVMQIAQVLSGYSLGKADLLRRAMGKKIKEEMDQQRAIFVDGAVANGVDATQASNIFDTVEKFAGYGFNKSHAMAYSVISYQTAFLKAHYPAEFFTAMLNLDLHNTDKINEFIADIKEHGIKVALPSVNKSEGLFVVSDDGKSIIYGLAALKGIGVEASKEIVEIRKEKGEFVDIFDFAQKCGKLANKKHLDSMIKSGCFDALHSNRKQLIDSIEDIIKYASSWDSSKNQPTTQESLFGDVEVKSVAKPELAKIVSDFMPMEKLSQEFEVIGFYLSSHPLDNYKEYIGKTVKITQASELDSVVPETKAIDIAMAGVVTKIKQRFGKKGRFAFLHLADLTGVFETMVFGDDLITSKRDLLTEGAMIVVKISAKRDLDSGIRLSVNDIYEAADVFFGRVNITLRDAPSGQSTPYSKSKKESEVAVPEIISNTLNKVPLAPIAYQTINTIEYKICNKNQINIQIYSREHLLQTLQKINDFMADENGVSVILQTPVKRIRIFKKISLQDALSLS
jgi:DNA polymerase-3 subunit alpha